MKQINCEIKEPCFTNIIDGKKKYEIVLNLGILSTLNVNDCIIWTNKEYGKLLHHTSIITNISNYSTLEDALSNINSLNELYPLASSADDAINKWRSSTSQSLENTYGVVLLEFK